MILRSMLYHKKKETEHKNLELALQSFFEIMFRPHFKSSIYIGTAQIVRLVVLCANFVRLYMKKSFAIVFLNNEKKKHICANVFKM